MQYKKIYILFKINYFFMKTKIIIIINLYKLCGLNHILVPKIDTAH